MEANKLRSNVNQVGWKLIQQICSQENSVFSPFNIAVTYVYLTLMTRNQTQAEFLEGLQEKDLTQLNDTTRAVFSDQNKEGLKNLLFFLSKQSLTQDFQAFSKEWNCSISADPMEVNQICNKETNGMIPQVVENPSPEESYLITITYFFSNWVTKFEDTRQREFFYADGSIKTINFMSHSFDSVLYSNAYCPILALPYKNGYQAMIAVPNDSPAEFIACVTPEDIFGFFDSAQFGKVNATIPEFEVESEFELNDAFQKAGIEEAFNPGKADFSAVFEEQSYIRKVLHKAKIKFDKEGTEAAAFTAGLTNCKTIDSNQPVEFTANRPFVVLIVKPAEKVILFATTIYEP